VRRWSFLIGRGAVGFLTGTPRGLFGCVVGHLVDGVVATAVVVALVRIAWSAEAFVGLSVFTCPQEAVAAVDSPFVGVGGEKVELTP